MQTTPQHTAVEEFISPDSEKLLTLTVFGQDFSSASMYHIDGDQRDLIASPLICQFNYDGAVWAADSNAVLITGRDTSGDPSRVSSAYEIHQQDGWKKARRYTGPLQKNYTKDFEIPR